MSRPVSEPDTAASGLSRRTLFRGAGVAGAAALVASAGAASAVSLSPEAGSSTEPLRLARVWFGRDQQALLSAFDDTHEVFDDGSIQVLLWPGDLARLRETGLRYEVQVDDLLARDAALLSGSGARLRTAGLALQPGERADGTYRTLADYEADMTALAKQHPRIVKKFALERPSLDGRTIHGVEIGQGARTGLRGEPTFLLMGVHHAREWPSGELAMEFAVDLVKSFGKNDRITGLLKKSRVLVVPVVNVDGFELSRTDGAAVDFRELDQGGTATILGTPPATATAGASRA